MAWYDDTQASTHTARYKNAYTARQEGRASAEQTIRNAVLSGGMSLLGGKRAHKSGVVTVTYVRNPA